MPNLDRFGDRIFVTGGSGFIGSHLVKMLCEMGKEVVCLVLPNDPCTLLQGVNYQRVDGDLCNVETYQSHLNGCDLVFHLAAIYALWLPNRHRMFEVNVEGTRQLLESAKCAGVKRVVMTSSIAAVGYREGGLSADESTLFNEWDVADDYVLSKYISELEALQASRWDPLEVIAVNPSFPFGWGDIGPTPTGRLVLTIIQGRLPFYTAGGFNGVHVGDVAIGHLLAAVRGTPGQRYLLTGHNVTYQAFFELVCDITDRPPPKRQVPTRLLQSAGSTLGWVSEHLTHRAPLMTKRSVSYTAGRFLYFSNNRAKQELGFAPRPLREALEASVEWFQHQQRS
jgi:dihydroflavonol-4-reductase